VKLKPEMLTEFRRNQKAASPIVSTVILTGAIVVLLIGVIIYANNFLEQRMTEFEFNTVKQFMQTAALQMDDVAWIPGRVQTIRYASRTGSMVFLNDTLEYSIYVGGQLVCNYSTGILMFNVPVSKYSIQNNYYELVFPTSREPSFLYNSSSDPIGNVFVIEKMPMPDGNYIRVVLVPCIRIQNSTVGNQNHVRIFLPLLKSGENPRRSQSVTLSGRSVLVNVSNNTRTDNPADYYVTVAFKAAGFDNSFFNFRSTAELIPNVTEGSIIEVYVGEVVVSIGLHG